MVCYPEQKLNMTNLKIEESSSCGTFKFIYRRNNVVGAKLRVGAEDYFSVHGQSIIVMISASHLIIPIHPSIQTSVHPSIQTSVHPSIQTSVHPAVRPSGRLAVWHFVRPRARAHARQRGHAHKGTRAHTHTHIYIYIYRYTVYSR